MIDDAFERINELDERLEVVERQIALLGQPIPPVQTWTSGGTFALPPKPPAADEEYDRINTLEEQVARLLDRTENLAWRDAYGVLADNKPAADDDAAKWEAVGEVVDERFTDLSLRNVDIAKAVVAKAAELGLVPRRELVVTDVLVDSATAVHWGLGEKGSWYFGEMRLVLDHAARYWSGEGEAE